MELRCGWVNSLRMKSAVMRSFKRSFVSNVLEEGTLLRNDMKHEAQELVAQTLVP